MSVAYVDTSCLVAAAFGEPAGRAVSGRLARFRTVLASNLLEAELRAVFMREDAELAPSLFSGISWVIPDRAMHGEIERVLAAGYVRGADCWHLATALYVSPEPGELTFLTLDARQRRVAETLGFEV
jgi:predicted nucleic acid-binding protein